MRQEFIQWLKSKELKDESIKDYLFYFDKFNVADFSQENVMKFVMEQYRNGIARAFIKNLKTFLIENRTNLNIGKEQISDIALISLPKITGRKKVRVMNIITEEDVLNIEEYMNSERNKIMLLLTYYGGLRIGGLIRVKGKDFNWDAWTKNKEKMGELIVLEKGDKERVVLIPPRLMLRIAKWINSSQVEKFYANSRLFPGKDRWRQLLEIASQKALGKKINPHSLRHSFATNMLKKGFRIEEVQGLLGHSDIKSTMVYIHLDKEDLKKKYLDSIGQK